MISIFLVFYSLYFFSLNTFPAPEFVIFPYLVNSGLQPYLQIVDQHMPGLFLLPINFASLGFVSPESFRVFYLIISIVQGTFILKTIKIIKHENQIYVLPIVFCLMLLFTINSLWYESFLVLTIIPSIYYLFKGNYKLSFFLLGLSILFKQTSLLYLIPLVLYSFNQQGLKKTIKYLILSLVPVVLLTGYYFSIGVLHEFIYWTTIFNFNTYTQLASQTPPLKVVTYIFGILILNSVSLVRFRNKYTLSIFLISLLSIVGGLIRYSSTQLIIFVSFSSVLLSLLIPTKKPLNVIALIILVVGVIIMSNRASNIFFNYYSEDIYEISKKVDILTNDKEEIFILGGQPHIYQLSKTIPTGMYFSYQLPWYTKINKNKIESTFADNLPKIILVDKEASIDGINIVNQFQLINSIVSLKYQLIDKYKNYEIYKIKN